MKHVYKVKVDFKGNEYGCMGYRIIEILNYSNPELKKCFWYMGDIITNTGYLNENIRDNTYHIKNFNELISQIDKDRQFIWGVFIATKKRITDNINLEAENIEELQVDDAIFELRAFDGLYFEIYTTNSKIYSRLKEKFCKYFYTIETIGNE